MNPTQRFSDRVRDYVKHRPGYPGGVVDAVLEGFGVDASVVDVGAGTGIMSRLLGDRGANVLAVEPNDAMREAAEVHERVRWHKGTAESTGLADGVCDVVVAAQAFHWFHAGAALREFARLLRAGGRAAVVWNAGDMTQAVARGYYNVVYSAGENARRVRDERAFVDPFVGLAGWSSQPDVEIKFVQRHDLEGLIGRAMSASYVPKEGEGRDRVLAGLRALFHEHAIAGEVELAYVCRVYRARVQA